VPTTGIGRFFSVRLRFWTQIDRLFPASKLDQKKNLAVSDTCGDGRAKDAAVAIGNWVFIFNQLTTTLKSFANSRRRAKVPFSGAKLTMIIGVMAASVTAIYSGTLFEIVVRRCKAEGLVGGEGFAVDASLIKADANRESGVQGAEGLDPVRSRRAVREYLAVLDDAAFGATTPVRY
jgi:hypothetical protein